MPILNPASPQLHMFTRLAFRAWVRCFLCVLIASAIVLALIPLSHARAAVTSGNLGAVTRYPQANGDTWYNTWSNDGDIYALSDDAKGFNGGCSSALTINELTGDDPTTLTSPYINCMSSYGGVDDIQGNADGRVWKASGIISVDGVLYATVERQNENSALNSYPNGYQPSGDTSIIKSTDHGHTWSNAYGTTNDPNGAAPTFNSSTNQWQAMFTSSNFSTPIFINYGQDDTPLTTADGGDTYVYAISTNGYVYDNSQLLLGRVRRDQIADLNASEWQFYTGGDGNNSANWSSNPATAQPILSSSSHQLSWTEAQYLPELHRYVMPEAGYPFNSSWFNNDQTATTNWTFYESPTPWGPWTSFYTADTTPNGWYAPAFVSKFSRVDDLSTTIFTSGDFVNQNKNGDFLYSLHAFPFTLTSDSYNVVDDTSSNITYTGNWTAGTYPNFYHNTIHYSSTAGASASFPFNGTFIQWISASNNNHGMANVSIDNGPAVTVDTYSPHIGEQTILFERTGLASGQHTITITLTGTKNANSSFTYTDIDAFQSAS